MFSVFSNKTVFYKADSYLKIVWSCYAGFLVLHNHANCFQRFLFSCLSTLILGDALGKIPQLKGKYSTYFCLDCADGWSWLWRHKADPSVLSDGSFTTAGVGDGMYICHVNDRHHALTAGNRVVI